jgi:Flp pilus assembly pilin Flp
LGSVRADVFRKTVRNGSPTRGRPSDRSSEGVDAVIVRTFARAKGWLRQLRRRASQQIGASSVEYAIMIGLIAAVIVLAVALLGRATSSGLNSVQIP